MQLPPLSPARVKSAIRRRAGQALGPDSWSSWELRQLGDAAVSCLSSLFRLFERGKSFPAESHDTIMAMLPKGQGIEALAQRPIG
eukprot:2724144-Alexandrium_andersonii.AAC.1